MDTPTSSPTPHNGQQPKSARRIGSGIAGLDDVLAGGLPKDRLYLVEGNPGTGKTTLALQFLREGVRQRETVLYVTLSETRHELFDVAESHGWSLDGISLYELESLRDDTENQEYSVFHPSEVELGETTARILRYVDEINPARVVFDSLSELRLLAQSALRYRREILALKQFFSGRKCTVLLLDDRTAAEDDLQLQSISHGVIRLDRLDSDFGVTRRRLHVVKMRSVKFRDGFHDYAIHTGGLAVFPRLVAAESRSLRESGEAKVSSGVPQVDQLLGGGLDRGTSSLFVGPAGSGKSSLATQFLCAAADRGEPVSTYIFEENLDTFVDRSTGMGMPVRAHLESGLLQVEQVDPAERSPGEFAHRVCEAVERHGSRMIVIDSLNGYLSSMPNEQFLLIQMHELLAWLAQKNIVTIVVMAQHGLMGKMDAPIEVSYLADTLVLFRYFEAKGKVRQAVSVLKKRKSAHERTIRELRFSDKGIWIGDPLRQFSGVLTGVPRLEKNQEDDRE